jgi:hypothetical protein
LGMILTKVNLTNFIYDRQLNLYLKFKQ